MSREPSTAVDATVRAVATEPWPRGGWTPDVDARLDRYEDGVEAVLERDLPALAEADRIAVVPDAHYPFHPSSGVVADPAVVVAIVAILERRTDADVAVAGRSDETIAFDRSATVLGYRSLLEGFAADLVDLAGEPTVERALADDADGTADREDRHPAAVSRCFVPERLVDDAVVVVPSLRPTAEDTIAGGMRTLSSLAGTTGADIESDTGTSDDGALAATATRAIDPVATVLDATVAYHGRPAATTHLFAGSTPAVDAIGSSLLERPIEADPALRRSFDGEPAIGVESVAYGDAEPDLAAVRDRLDGGGLPPADDTHPAVTAAYRLYAAIGGDAVPPQLEGGVR
ncbi:DUF362 domain-containing protein [Halopiger goleimassiliensis]|uniref:DUF362 domain-containing protein n=1 Tax=Halopiger goleimassiliensis TaxID=1293048 RepID=UPI00067787A6|nr:DUF362 domain-containing protein [Halopiger goleimassiliensis]